MVVREKAAPKPEPVRETIRAHVINRKPRVRPVKTHEYVTANAHITPDSVGTKPKRVRELVVANAHITTDTKPKKIARRIRDSIVANAHITSDAPTALAAKPKREREYVTPITHITRESKMRKPKAVKPEPEFESVDVNIFAGGMSVHCMHHCSCFHHLPLCVLYCHTDNAYAPQAPAVKEEAPEPELVSADIKRN